jgi:hypothetical protein
MTQLNIDDRPRPIYEAANSVGTANGVAGSLVTALAGWGIFTLAQGDALQSLLGAIPGLVTLVTTLLAAFGVVRRSEPQVTPLSDPRDDMGVSLRPVA